MAKTYDTYKDSGIAWIDMIPERWDVCRYKNVCSIQSGFPFESSKFSIQSGFPLIRIRDITSGKIETYFNGDYSEEYIVKKGDLIIGMDGDFSIRIWKNRDGLLNQRCCRLYEKECANKTFLFYALPMTLKRINDLAYATTVKHLSNNDIYGSTIALPPLSEQQAIATYLDEKCDEIDSLISLQEEMISELQSYKQSVITEAVTKGLDPNVPMKDSGVEWIGMIPEGWNICKLKFLCSSIKDGSHFSPTTTEEGFPYITAADVHGKGLDYANAKKISEKDYNDLVQSGCKAEKDDILLVKDGATTGRVGMKIENNPCVLLSSVAMLRVNTKAYPTYLMYMVSSDLLQQQISIAMAGSAMPRITLTKLNTFIALEVPLSEQQAIASYLDEKTSQIDSLIAIKQEKITELKDYKKSIIYEYVTGKKKV